VGADLLEIVREEGLETVDGCLESWLHEASAFGSGDDVTLGLLCRADVSARRVEAAMAASIDEAWDVLPAGAGAAAPE